MFLSVNCGHRHSAVLEAKQCIGLAPKWEEPIGRLPQDQPASMTRKQFDFLKSLGVPDDQLRSNGEIISKTAASELISKTLAENKKKEAEKKLDPKLEFLKGMLPSIPDGYFAVRKDANEKHSFIRISTPKTGRFKGTRKIQTQHSEAWFNRAALWPDGRLSVARGFNPEHILIILADAEGAGIEYANEIGKCCRCNAALTDERSRWYGIGPECEKHWPHILMRVEERYGEYQPGRTR